MYRNFLLAIAIIIIVNFTGTAQSGKRTYATFKECENAGPDSDCYSEKLRADLNNLMSDEIAQHIKKTSTYDHMPISFAFLSDAEGKVMAETVEVACEESLLRNALKNYIDNLAPFLPKNDGMDENRSAHISTYTYLYNEQTDKFEITTYDILREKGIRPKYIRLGIQPACKGCENDNQELAYKCSSEKITKVMLRKFRTQEVKPVAKQQRLVATFIVEKNGDITISDVVSIPYNISASEEYRRALKKLPEFNPGSFRGIPVRASFNLPVTLNF